MASTDDLDDDYVARLLVEDARRTSKKYAHQGVSSFISDGRSSNAPKPNTRFLSHIVREADHHNAALRRKEKTESDLRLLALERHDHPRKRRRIDEDDHHRRSRLIKDISDAASSTKRSRHRELHGTRPSNYEGARESRNKHREQDSTRLHREQSDRERKRERTEGYAEDDERSKSREASHHKQRDSMTKSKRSDHPEKHITRSVSPESSDPLEEVVSGRIYSTKLKSSSRGSRKLTSDMDGHFLADYDPSHDVTLDSNDDEVGDWDMALEALRDRAKWKSKQSARLREAGFDEHEISRWKNSALEVKEHSLNTDPSSLRWSKRDEVREWDKGKISQ